MDIIESKSNFENIGNNFQRMNNLHIKNINKIQNQLEEINIIMPLNSSNKIIKTDSSIIDTKNNNNKNKVFSKNLLSTMPISKNSCHSSSHLKRNLIKNAHTLYSQIQINIYNNFKNNLIILEEKYILLH